MDLWVNSGTTALISPEQMNARVVLRGRIYRCHQPFYAGSVAEPLSYKLQNIGVGDFPSRDIELSCGFDIRLLKLCRRTGVYP